jgi:hypothetical protein
MASYGNTGNTAHLHPGGVVNPAGSHVHGQPGALHPGTGMNTGGMNTGGMNTGTGMNTAPVAETQDNTRDRRSHSSTSTKNTTMTKEDKVGVVEKAINTYGRIMSLLAILGALAATLLYFGGLGSLQKRSNNLNTTRAGYSETFQSSLQVPYPGSGSDQWAFQWYIGAIQFFVTMLCLFTLCLPQRILQRFKPATMVLLGYCLVLFTYEVQSLLFLKRNALARSIFSKKRILITLIGAIAIAIFDGLTLLNLTLLKETNRDLFGGGGKRVAEEAQHHQSTDDRDFEHERNVHHGPGHHGANAV